MKINLKPAFLGIGLTLVFVGALIFADDKLFDDKVFLVDGYTWEKMDVEGVSLQQLGYVQGYQDAANLFYLKIIGEALYRASHEVELGTKLTLGQKDTLEKLGAKLVSVVIIDSLQYLGLAYIINEVFWENFPPGTLGQTRDAVTDFYSDYRMKRVKLPLAMRVIKLVLKGHAKEEIEQAKRDLLQGQPEYYKLPVIKDIGVSAIVPRSTK